jgi:hypothetical protein
MFFLNNQAVISKKEIGLDNQDEANMLQNKAK